MSMDGPSLTRGPVRLCHAASTPCNSLYEEYWQVGKAGTLFSAASQLALLSLSV